MDNEAAATEAVHRFVWSGFYRAREIASIIEEEMFAPGEIERRWLRGIIKEEFRKKRDAEAGWPEVTDCDRLDVVFEAMNEHGIVALQNAGYTQSDGISDVTEYYEEAGGTDSHIVAFCFYHGQDLERVVDSGELFLTFGDINGDDNKGANVGRRIQGMLQQAGFSVEWDGTIKTRILIKDMKWQRRGDDDQQPSTSTLPRESRRTRR